MRPSLRLGTFSGITIGLHWSIALIAVLLGSTLAGVILPASVAGLPALTYWMVAMATVALFLASIVAHELGHSLMAQRDGVKVGGITLFALGGVAALESEPKTPGAAARIALAGPAVSVVIGAGSLFLSGVMAALGWPAVVVSAVQWLGVINLMLAVFNMLPALPLDGGRVLQAALWKRKGNTHEATISAAKLGRLMGWALVGFGFWQFTLGASGLWTMFIGWFIITNAKAEAGRAKIERRREQLAANGYGDNAWPLGPWVIDLSGGPRVAPPRDPRPHRPVDDDVIDVESWEVASPHR